MEPSIQPDQQRFVYLMCKELGQELRFVEEVNQAKKNRRKPRPRVVVVTDFLLVMIKREGKTKLKVTHTAHLLDLKKISSREPQRVELTFQRSSKPHTLILLTRLVKELLLATRSSIATITRGFPDSSLPQVDVHDNLLLQLDPIDYGPANGFLHTYRAYCFYYDMPVSHALMQYVTDMVFAKVVDFSIGDCPGIEGKHNLDFNLLPICAALRHNTYFRSISAVGVKSKDLLFHTTNLLRYNTLISKVALSDLAESNITELGEALNANPNHAVQILDLSLTHIHKGVGALALALQNFKHSLKVLNLCNCNLDASKCLMLVQALSSNYGMSINIEELYLGGNKFDEQTSLALESWLSKVSEYSALRVLSLANTGGNMAVVCTYFHFLKHIEELNISRNKLDPRSVQVVTSMIEKSATLRKISVANCNLSTQSGAMLLTAMITNKRLQKTHVNLSGNEFSDVDSELLAVALTCNTNCHTLDISHNLFKEKALICIFQAIVLSASDTLDTLIIDKTYKKSYPGDSVASALFSVVNSLGSIKSLRMRGGYGSVIVTFLGMLQANNTLLELDIADNRAGDVGASAIADFLRHNQYIASLQCDGNNIGPTGWKMILASFIANSTLAHMDFAWNDYARCSKDMPTKKLLELQAVLLDIQRTVQTNSNDAARSRRFHTIKARPVPLGVAPLAEVPEKLVKSNSPRHFRRLSDDLSKRTASTSTDSALRRSMPISNGGAQRPTRELPKPDNSRMSPSTRLSIGMAGAVPREAQTGDSMLSWGSSAAAVPTSNGTDADTQRDLDSMYVDYSSFDSDDSSEYSDEGESREDKHSVTLANLGSVSSSPTTKRLSIGPPSRPMPSPSTALKPRSHTPTPSHGTPSHASTSSHASPPPSPHVRTNGSASSEEVAEERVYSSDEDFDI